MVDSHVGNALGKVFKIPFKKRKLINSYHRPWREGRMDWE